MTRVFHLSNCWRRNPCLEYFEVHLMKLEQDFQVRCMKGLGVPMLHKLKCVLGMLPVSQFAEISQLESVLGMLLVNQFAEISKT